MQGRMSSGWSAAAIRLSGTDYEPDGFPIEDTIAMAKVLEKEGIDAGPDVLGMVGSRLVGPLGIRPQGTAQAHKVALAAGDDLFGVLGQGDGAGGDDRHLHEAAAPEFKADIRPFMQYQITVMAL